MVITRLIGGLGNQLFQYAAGRALALDHGQPLLLDVSFMRFFPERQFQLNAYDIDAQVHDDPDADELRLRDIELNRKACAEQFGAELIEESQTAPSDVLAQVAQAEHVYLAGYWQKPRHFDHHAQVFRDEFTPRELSDSVRADAERLNAHPAVSLHVRRGDYVADPHVAERLGCLDVDYYFRAIDELARRGVDDPSIHVFSDEPEWCSRHLSLPADFSVMPEGRSPVEDLHLLANCTHSVTANSSFSWWGAWLKARDGLTITPNAWYRSDELDTSELRAEGWISV